MLCCNLFTVIFFLLVCTGTAQRASILQQNSAAPLLKWRFSVTAPIYSSPVTDGEAIYTGTCDSSFYAVDILSGKLKWSFKTAGQIRSTALLHGTHIYFISGDGKLYCVSKEGKLIWAFAGKEKKYDFADYHQSSPIINNGTLYAGMGDGNLYALQAGSGQVLWKFKTGGPIHNTTVTDGSTIYFGSFDGYVYGVGINTHTARWKFKTVGHNYFPKGEVQGNPALINNTVVVGARDYNVYALDKEKGFARWNKAYTRGWVLSASSRDSMLYLAGADERILTAIHTQTGIEKWKRTMELLMFGRPAFATDMLYMGTTMGKLHAIDINTGEDKWVFATDGYTQNHLKFFKEDDSYRDDIYAVITSDEAFLAAQEKIGGIFSTPLLYNNLLLFTSTEGAIYCLKVSD